jgi:hypothetical protein
VSQRPDAAYIQELPLDDASGVEINGARLDLIVETDPSLQGVARLLADSPEGAPHLSLRGTNVRLTQDGHYRGSAPPVLRLPQASLEGLAANLSRGSLTLENLTMNIAVNIDNGHLKVSGGGGNMAVNVASGEALIQDREGNLACRIDRGQIDLTRCRGELVVDISKGDVRVRECGGSLRLKIDKGDVSLTRPIEQQLAVQSASSDVSIRGGSLTSADIDLVRGDISSSARLLFTTPAEPADEIDDDESMDEAEIVDFGEVLNDVISGIGEEVEFNLGSVQFVAGEGGVRISSGGTDIFQADEGGLRISRGGTDVFRAGPEGLVVRRSDGTPIFVANEQGISTGPRGRGNEQFRFATGRGSIALDIHEDQPARVELIVNRGTAQSDIPLVEVGRPGPRSSTRRYVGVSDSSEMERILIRARTNRGDIRVRSVEAGHEQTPSSPASERDRRRRAILEALARGRLTAEEADVLLAAMEREAR